VNQYCEAESLPALSLRNTRTMRWLITCIRPHTSAYVNGEPILRGGGVASSSLGIRPHTSAYVRIRQHTSAYVSEEAESLPAPALSLRNTRAMRWLITCMLKHASACVGMRRNTSAYVNIHQHTSAYTRTLFKAHNALLGVRVYADVC
jgi:hypothetical protein